MRYMFHLFVLCLINTLLSCSRTPNARKIFANVSLDSNDFSNNLPFIDYNGIKLYFAYYNTVVEGSDDTAHSYRLLDNIIPGLSVFTHPAIHTEKDGKHIANRHISSYLGSWCYILTLFMFYPRFKTDQTNHSNLFSELYTRCMVLNGGLSSDNLREYSSTLLFSPDLTLDSLYLFEKLSRMCPRPLYFNTKDVGSCSKHTDLNNIDIMNDFFAHRECYMNDVMDLNFIPYGKLNKDSTRSIKSLTDPSAVLNLYLEKWNYIYMPKRTELELSMDVLSLSLLMKLLSDSNTTKASDIRTILYSADVTNLRVNFIIGAMCVDCGSNSPTKNKNYAQISFGLSFDLKDNNNMLKCFDAPINEENMGKLYQALRVNREGEGICSLGYQNISGLGQHRWVTISISLDKESLRSYTSKNGNYYVKLVHMLDSSVYLDNDELETMYIRVEDESEIFRLNPSSFSANEDGSAEINLEVFKTPFINIEEPETNSSPIIYSSYAILAESMLKYSPLRISYKLPIHSRYMNMNKSLTQEIMSIDKLGLLDGKKRPKYDLSLTSEPRLFIYSENNTKGQSLFEETTENYLRFLRKISFATFVSNNSDQPNSSGTWRRLYFRSSNDTGRYIDLCKGERTGIAYVSRKFNTEACNPIITEMKRSVVDSERYLVFSIPIGSQDYFQLINNVTIGVITLSCLFSLFFVCNYLRDTTYKSGLQKDL